MPFISRLFNKIVLFMNIGSGCILVSMIIIVLIDVSTRFLFKETSGQINWTFNGAVEYIRYGLLFTLLFSFPYSAHKSQVVVALLTTKMSLGTQYRLDRFFNFIFFLFALGITHGFYVSFRHALESKQTTQDLLIPMAPLYLIASFATLILAIQMGLLSIQRHSATILKRKSVKPAHKLTRHEGQS